MNCPNCKKDLPESETRTESLVIPEGQLFGKRITRFAECPCGAVSTLQSWQGWERWYVTRYTTGRGGLPQRHDPRGPDYDAFYLRAQNGGAS